MFDAAISDHQ